MVISGGSQPFDHEYTTLFRHGELTLLLRPLQPPSAQPTTPPPAEWSTLDGDAKEELEAFFRELRVPLLGGGNSLRGVDGEIRKLIPVMRYDTAQQSDRPNGGASSGAGGGYTVAFAHLTVNLASWLAYPLHLGNSEAALRAIDRSIEDVGTAVAKVNEVLSVPGSVKPFGNYELVAVAPNWLGVAVDDGCADGGPPQAGGTAGHTLTLIAPFPPFPRFAPWDVLSEVQRGLDVLNAVQNTGGASAAGVSLPQRAFGHFGDGIEVAVFDTWPIDETRGDWLALLRDARDREAKAGNETGRHDELLSALSLAKFRDYVAGTPLELMHSHRTDGHGVLEPNYTHRDHGLFVTDIINDIAPKAHLSIYRVLNDYGVGQFDVVAAAVAEAISDARGKPLVINLSLAFGPVLTMLKEFLGGPLAAHQNGRLWSTTANAKLRNGRNPTLEQEAANHPTMKAVSLACGVHSLRKAFAVAAAGNDSSRNSQPALVAAPRVPAVVEGVLGVSAAALDSTCALAAGLASYSDDDDIDTTRDDGVTALGGEIDETTSPSKSVDGPIGLFVSSVNGAAPAYGRVTWSGTSFAAPVATGLAACIWSEVKGLPAIAVPDAQTFPPAVDLLTAIVKPGDPEANRIPLVQRV